MSATPDNRPGFPELCGQPDAGQGRNNRDPAITLVYRIFQPERRKKEAFMTETVVKLRLNQQQLELMDRTIAQGVAPDRVSLVRLALREYAATHKMDAIEETSR
jgi:hypothetical protein